MTERKPRTKTKPKPVDTADRHKVNPLTFRPPADDRNWLISHARTTGQSIGAVLTRALQEHRKNTEDTEPDPKGPDR